MPGNNRITSGLESTTSEKKVKNPSMLSVNKDMVNPEVHKMHLQREGLFFLQDSISLGAARKTEVK